MPDATITSTASTFGTISGTFAADQSTVTGTVTAIIPGTLSGSVGVPGPQGPAGATGPQGPAGSAGVGVPVGGTTGQVLAKTSNTDYATGWTTLDVSGLRSLTDFDFTNVSDSYIETYGLSIDALTTDAWTCDSFLKGSELQLVTDTSNNGLQTGEFFQSKVSVQKVSGLFKSFGDVDGTIVVQDDLGYALDYNGLTFGTETTNPESGTNRYLRSSIVFGNGTTQTIAFPGFNNVALTGNSTAVTAALGDNDTSIATTAFVQQELLSGTANAKNLEVYVRNQTGSTLAAGTIVYVNGATGNRPTVTPAQANNDANSAQTIGFVKTSIANNGFGYVIVRGELENINTSALTEGVQLYLSPTTAGTWTTTKPSAPQHLVYVGIVIRSHPTLGVILVSVQNGYEVAELHDSAITTPANNDLFVYESSTDLWKNKSFSTLGLATQSYVTSQGYITSSALTGYATESWVTTALGSYLTTATAASTYQTQAGMSSYLTTSAAASTYAPIASPTFTGTVTIPAGASISGYAPLASPTFTGTPSLPTGTTAVTQAAGNNTTAVATTAFVQQEVPAASTTAAGKVELATNAEVIAGTSTTLALVPGHAGFLKADPRLRSLSFINGSSISGSGVATTSTPQTFSRQVYLNTLNAGRACFIFGAIGSTSSGFGGSLTNNTQVDFSKKVWMSGYASMGTSTSSPSYIGDANTICRITLGGYSTQTTGDMTLRGIGLKKVGGASSFVTLTVHNGTTLTDVASTVTVPDTGGIHWVIYSDGTGNVTLYINGSQAATTTAGPTSATASGQACYREQVEAVSTPGIRGALNCNGGWLYIE